MKTILRTGLLIVLLAGGWIVWTQEVPHESKPKAAGAVRANEEIIKTAERLAERLRAVQRSAETNKETRK